MARTRIFRTKYRHWRQIALAGVVCFTATLLAIATFSARSMTLSALLIGFAGSLFGVSVIGSLSGWHIRRRLRDRNGLLDAAVGNMVQGLCMFDAQNRLLLWNDRYQSMYKINSRHIWHGCTIRDLLDARTAAGTFPLDPSRYDAAVRAALSSGETFAVTMELADGRTINVINQPIKSGGWLATHEDITERRQAERELEQTRSFLHTVIENVPSPIIVKGAQDLRYMLINRAAEKYLGLDRETLLGKRVIEVIPETYTARHIEEQDRKLVESGKAIYLDEHTVATPANGTRIVSTTRLPVNGADGKLQYIITVIRDLTERRRHEQQIEHLAHHDPLTDLPNRGAFNECIAATVDVANGSGDSFALLSFDLDGFKAVNDVYGHGVGDALLREISARLTQACQGAFIARVGGDEFHVITPTGPQPAAAEALAARLSQSLDSDVDIDGVPLRVAATFGVAIFPQDGTDAVTLTANADAALFRAKSEARGSIRFFELSMDQQLRDKRALQQDLRSAVARGEIELYYQPQTHIGGSVSGFEALVRWHHPRHGVVSPATFIPLAEESGLIVELGEWILREACREAASWPRPLCIGVNLSPVQFRHGDLPALVHQILLETGLPPSRLELEITEGVLIGDFNRAVSILRRLKALGARIAMDDFGTGYSSLSYLQSFPFDKIKIDKSFITNLGQSQQSATIVRAVIALGRGLNVPVLAEGVETEAQLKFLAAEHCNEIQGYYVGRPKPIADYAELVGRRGSRPKLAVVG